MIRTFSSILSKKRQKLNVELFAIILNGDLKNVELRNKITSMQCSWVKRLVEDELHYWKVMPLFLIG